jgi:hypothetical protein
MDAGCRQRDRRTFYFGANGRARAAIVCPYVMCLNRFAEVGA